MFCNNLNVDLIPDFTVKVKGFDIKLLGKEFFESYFDETIGANGEHGYISKIYGNKYNKKALKLGNSFLKYYTFIFNQDTGSVSVGDFNDIFPKGTEGASTHIRGPRRWGRRGFSGTESLGAEATLRPHGSVRLLRGRGHIRRQPLQGRYTPGSKRATAGRTDVHTGADSRREKRTESRHHATRDHRPPRGRLLHRTHTSRLARGRLRGADSC